MRALRFARWGLAATALFAVAGCGADDPSTAPPTTVTATSGTPFTLAIGDTAQLDTGRLAVTLTNVSGDSRCPEDVTCAWAGDITVTVTARIDSAETSYSLHPNPQASSATTNGYRIQLQSVRPGRHTNRQIPSADYRVDLLVSPA
ncbi:hypothetical protein ACFVUS_05060 [Nocardia sp. NPDC058058]|uniref:hypothetical protein n=1 Tax=Nocardia sp. NPDC058058 TaxID=3346317 RepID=UPI0036DE2D8F